MGFIVQDKGTPGFEEVWESFSTLSRVPWQYCSRVIDYYREYSSDAYVKDASFSLLHNGDPVAICPVFIEKEKGITSLSIARGASFSAPFPLPSLNRRQRDKVYTLCFEHLEHLAAKHEVDVSKCSICDFNTHKYNLLLKYGYLDITDCTCVIDTSKNLKDIWTDVRKSNRSVIKRGEDVYVVDILSSKNIKMHNILDYQAMHEKAAGRKTRPLSTFIKQLDMVYDDKAMMLVVKDSDVAVGYYFFIHYNDSACYGSSAADPGYDAKHQFGQFAIWNAIVWYKQNGVRWFDVGIQHFGPQMHCVPSRKEMDISFFKRGFGGEVRSLYSGVKYYDNDLLRLDLATMLENYTTAIIGENHE